MRKSFNRRLWFVIAVVIMIVSVFYIIGGETKAYAASNIKLRVYANAVNRNQNNFNQFIGSSGKNEGCMCTAYAIAYSIVDKKDHSPTEFSAYGGPDAYDRYGKAGGYEAYSAKKLYDAINAKKPVLVHLGNYHWATVIGYRSSINVLNPGSDDFIAIDPWGGKELGLTSCQGKTPVAMKIINASGEFESYYDSTIVLDACGGTVNPASYGINFGDYWNLPTPSRKGYKFGGWYRQKEGKGEQAKNSDRYWGKNETVTLYANWVTDSTIVLDACGGTVNPASYGINFGDYWNLPTPSRKGYKFGGWYRQKEGKGEQAKNSDRYWGRNETVTLYANWVNDGTEPTAAAISGPTSGEAGEELSFTWSDTQNTTHYYLRFYKKENGSYKFISNPKLTSDVHSYSAAFNEGEYMLLVQAYNRGVWKEDYSDYKYAESAHYFSVYAKQELTSLSKQKNTLKIRVASKTYKRSKLKKAKKFSIGVLKAQGKVTYTLNKAAKRVKIRVTKKGKVTIPRKCRKGTYKITVRAAGNENYKAGRKTVTIYVK